ncbi:MAG: 3-methyl-2-oxobutanoate hydroxymethyltransferase [Firmicutes bacterium]|nr:3-methyl-2-oxobutanoate hydroxymethyltransferase [Bacillota bacterium]
MKRVTTETFRRKKTAGEKIVMVTAYDFPFARLVDEAGVDGILVGDSLGMVVLGYETTIPVTMEEILHHTRAVLRGARRALVVADLPFLSYQTGEEEALRNAGSLLKAGAAAVKLEGGREYAGMVKRMVTAGIPVMGHLGLTPQSIHEFGGYGLRAKEAASAVKLLEDALALAEAGVFAIVLEKIPREVAAEVTARCPVPTIGIGSGPDCDGQVLVLHDLLGLYEEFKPRFVKRYAELGAAVREAVGRYVSEVRGGEFPGPEHAWGMEPDQLATFRAQLDQMEGGTNDTGQDR